MVELEEEFAMHHIERAVSDWQRVYARLCAVQDWLQRAEGGPPGDLIVTGDDPVAELHRLQDEEELALRAIHEALAAAKSRATGAGARSGAGSPE